MTCGKQPCLGERNSAAHPDTAAGLDHNYVLDSEPGDKIAAILLDPESRHRLIVATDAPGLQVYTGEYLPQARQGIALGSPGLPQCRQYPPLPQRHSASRPIRHAQHYLDCQIGGMPESRFRQKTALQQRPLRAFLCRHAASGGRVKPFRRYLLEPFRDAFQGTAYKTRSATETRLS